MHEVCYRGIVIPQDSVIGIEGRHCVGLMGSGSSRTVLVMDPRLGSSITRQQNTI